MRKLLLKCVVVVLATTVLLEAPSAFAILGIRAARTAIAARRAAQKVNAPDEAGKKDLSGKQRDVRDPEAENASSQNVK
jgi:hypothetical protein